MRRDEPPVLETLSWAPVDAPAMSFMRRSDQSGLGALGKGVTGDPRVCLGVGDNLGKQKAAFLP